MDNTNDTPGWLQDIAGLSNIALTWYHTLSTPKAATAASGTATVTVTPGTVQATLSPVLVLVAGGVLVWLVLRK